MHPLAESVAAVAAATLFFVAGQGHFRAAAQLVDELVRRQAVYEIGHL
jgi:hypothetical protein